MATKMKGIYKSFKFISQIFVVKEREMEIGYPTDVKHVAHIGWDGPSGSAPSWMTEFKTAPDFSATSLVNIGEGRDSNAISTWSSQDFEQSMGQQTTAEMFSDLASNEARSVSKKTKRKKCKSASSPSSSTSPSSRGFRLPKPKPSYNSMEAAQNLQIL
ncbi:hypothetical protein UlMin_011376 [Ulmus minor]